MKFKERKRKKRSNQEKEGNEWKGKFNFNTIQVRESTGMSLN